MQGICICNFSLDHYDITLYLKVRVSCIKAGYSVIHRDNDACVVSNTIRCFSISPFHFYNNNLKQSLIFVIQFSQSHDKTAMNVNF